MTQVILTEGVVVADSDECEVVQGHQDTVHCQLVHYMERDDWSQNWAIRLYCEAAGGEGGSKVVRPIGPGIGISTGRDGGAFFAKLWAEYNRTNPARRDLVLDGHGRVSGVRRKRTQKTANVRESAAPQDGGCIENADGATRPA
ncbi:MAG: hypothetical protein FWD57_02390 [Polyangiaceae bacterium]|nr:hypothetical protein [Polyangiaceae bacterium]